MRTPMYHEKELELFCIAENIETPHVYECEVDNQRALKYRCLDCSCTTYIPNMEALEISREKKEKRSRRMEE